jgi:uncharacterized membrane protein YhiD involved in acid resistance
MEPFWGEWLALAIYAIVLALILTAPLLVGILIIRVLRKRVSEDRQAFENEIRSKLEVIAESQTEMKKQLDDLLKQ